MSRHRPAWLPLWATSRRERGRLLYFGLTLRGLEALPAPDQLVAPDSSD